ncbi:hypothetical protein PTTG_04879 [Puccinia triticina 1-1 BBBD Race 1]|uniref:DDE Tnp4 domain-containing protein n=1 Tax=Puccinia triticina (isolate 1-1 / race 1 (BBBD)) TaxID=630390 RepID=A0A0C4EVP3_PUCT1|nr:hypothetical protein PTTG_04879 [Puccinia triticina 1-1 BBBD Race 1]
MPQFLARNACISAIKTKLERKLTIITLDALLGHEEDSLEDDSGHESSGKEEDPNFFEIDELMKLLQAIHSKQYFGPRNRLQKDPDQNDFCLVHLEDHQFKQEFQMSCDSFFKLCECIAEDPVFQNNSNNPQRPVPKHMMVAAKLMGCFGNGASVGMLARVFQVGEGTVELYTNQ